MAGRGHSTGGSTGQSGPKPMMSEKEKKARQAAKYYQRKKNALNHRKDRQLYQVAKGIASEVPAFANATKVLANIEDIHEHLSGYMNAGVAVLGENFPALVQQSIEKAMDQYDEDGNLVREGDAQERRFLIQKMIDLKPLVEGGSFKNQSMMDTMRNLLEEDGIKMTATERKIEVVRD